MLADKRESISPEGVPRTEYLWRHKPTYENVRRPQEPPQYVGAGIGDISAPRAAAPGRNSGRQSDSSNYSSERDYVLNDSRNGGNRGGEKHVFRDSGYGSGGNLPGTNDGGDLNSKFDQMRVSVGNNRPYDPQDRATIDRTPREVRTKKSSVDLRRVAGEQGGIKY